ncbi:MAG: oxidoreductase [Pseudomonadota bacterium]|nr:oxidoreductase [Pseudomonadota bacterium]
MTQKVALVTGASAGMGKDFVKALLGEGMVVYAVARRVENMEDLKALGAHPLKMDITKEEDVQSVVHTISKEHGGVDVLINNAGFGSYGSVEDTTIEDARYQFEVNLFGLARLTQLVLPYMRSKQAGKVINISSMVGKVYMPLGAWYVGTKHALEGWSDCLRVELKQFGIDVVIIEPGAIVTEFGDVVSGPMMERSGNGPYSNMAHKVDEMFKAEYEKGAGSPVSVITNLVLKAIRAKKPKTRYVAGKYAMPMMLMRKWLGDRFYDRALMNMMK